MRPILRLLVSCLPLLSLPSLAATVPDLYEVHQPVTSQQPEARNGALNQALDTLILRLTGDPKAAASPAFSEVRKDPQQLVSQYRYEGDTLVVDFDPMSTERSLRQAGLSLWSSNRPALVTWWLNETVAGTSLIGDGQSSAAPLRQAAQHRGLPLRLPLADLGEQLLATPEALAANDPQALREASERYAGDALLTVQAREADGAWQAQWRVWLGDEREQGRAEGADQAALADAVLRAVSERLAPRFVVAPGAARRLEVQVEGTTLARYAELQRLLEPFAGQLSQVQGERLVFQVSASAEQVRAQLALAQLHEVPVAAEPEPAAEASATAPAAPAAPDAGAPVQGAAEDVLRFRW